MVRIKDRIRDCVSDKEKLGNEVQEAVRVKMRAREKFMGGEQEHGVRVDEISGAGKDLE